MQTHTGAAAATAIGDAELSAVLYQQLIKDIGKDKELQFLLGFEHFQTMQSDFPFRLRIYSTQHCY
jgi:hypothetical protein